MNVDSYRFLPRSFLALYQNAQPLPGEDAPVWTAPAVRAAEGTVALLTSAGLSVAGAQDRFDLERERQDPLWGDPTFRPIPHDHGPLEMSHLHVNNADVLADNNVALPVGALDELVADGIVGAAAPTHVSVMGYQASGLEEWRTVTAPAVVDLLRAESVDGVVLAPV